MSGTLYVKHVNLWELSKQHADELDAVIAASREPAQGLLYCDRCGQVIDYKVTCEECLEDLGLLNTDNGWQPISSAPRDGRYLLLADGDYDPVIGHYVDFEQCGGAPEGYHSGWFDNISGHHEIQPTHWMPLPAAPRDAEDARPLDPQELRQMLGDIDRLLQTPLCDLALWDEEQQILAAGILEKTIVLIETLLASARQEAAPTPEIDWRTCGIIELAIRNPNVSSYMEHWEGRALKAEAALAWQPIERAGAASVPLPSHRAQNEQDLARVDEQTVMPSERATAADNEPNRAEIIAKLAHHGQVDKVGEPYEQHLGRVAWAMDDEDEIGQTVAWLHDTLEDTRLHEADLYTLGFSAEVCRAVVLLTRTPPHNYQDYIDHLIESGNRLALRVKRADLQDHLNEHCQPHLRVRYEAALEAVERALAVDAVARSAGASTDGPTHWMPLPAAPRDAEDARPLDPQVVVDRAAFDQAHGIRRWTEVLCQQCGGNGVIKIPHGISVCPRCDGSCYDPADTPWPARQEATPTRGQEAQIVKETQER